VHARETTAPPLGATARALVDELPADAALVSRAVGDVLIAVAEHSPRGALLRGGHVVLLSDYPDTLRVLHRGEPSIVTVGETTADRAEVELLESLGFASLLMLPLGPPEAPWGLVEAYRAGGTFSAADLAVARRLVASLAEAVHVRPPP
jgi:hypothetical protein